MAWCWTGNKPLPDPMVTHFTDPYGKKKTRPCDLLKEYWVFRHSHRILGYSHRHFYLVPMEPRHGLSVGDHFNQGLSVSNGMDIFKIMPEMWNIWSTCVKEWYLCLNWREYNIWIQICYIKINNFINILRKFMTFSKSKYTNLGQIFALHSITKNYRSYKNLPG